MAKGDEPTKKCKVIDRKFWSIEDYKTEKRQKTKPVKLRRKSVKCAKIKCLERSKTAHTKKHTHKKNCVDKNWQQNLYKKKQTQTTTEGWKWKKKNNNKKRQTNKQTKKMQFQGKSSNTESGNLTWLAYIDEWQAISVTTIIDRSPNLKVVVISVLNIGSIITK